jgi:hypothetical protein
MRPLKYLFPTARGGALCVALLSALGAAAPAVARTGARPLYMQAVSDAVRSGGTVAGVPQSALFSGRSAGPDGRALRPLLFHICQQQDPTTFAVPAALATLVCYRTAY